MITLKVTIKNGMHFHHCSQKALNEHLATYCSNLSYFEGHLSLLHNALTAFGTCSVSQSLHFYRSKCIGPKERIKSNEFSLYWEQIICGDHHTCETSHCLRHSVINALWIRHNFVCLTDLILKSLKSPEMSTSEGKIQMGYLLMLCSGQIPL